MSMEPTEGIRESTFITGVITMLTYIINRLARDEEGQTMAEYAVVLAVITIAVVVTLGLLSTGISTALKNVIDSL